MRAADHRDIAARVRPPIGWMDLHSAPCCRDAEIICQGHPLHPGVCVCAYITLCSRHGLFHVGTHD